MYVISQMTAKRDRGQVVCGGTHLSLCIDSSGPATLLLRTKHTGSMVPEGQYPPVCALSCTQAQKPLIRWASRDGQAENVVVSYCVPIIPPLPFFGAWLPSRSRMIHDQRTVTQSKYLA